MFRSAGKPLDFLPSPMEIARFLGKCEVMDLPGTDSHGCWRWKGALTDGYGTFSLRRKNQRANRVSFQVFVGALEPNEDVHHECRNSWCVNPRHLVAETHSLHGAESSAYGKSLMVAVSFFGGPMDGQERKFVGNNIPELYEFKVYGQVDTYRYSEEQREFMYDGYRRLRRR